MEELLRMQNVSKQFGDIYANKDINFTVKKGEVHTLLGENGAGKSTLMNILIGLYHPTQGDIFLRGQKVKMENPALAVKLGIGMVHQHFMLVENMTVFENIILGISQDHSLFINKEKKAKEILAFADKYGFNIDLNKVIEDISVGEQQRVEILKALYRGAEILILDEPTAALTDIEVEGLFDIINRLTKEGKSVVFISHKMREVLKISDRITILRAGKTIKTLNKQDTNAEELASLMIGRDLVANTHKKVKSTQSPVIAMEQVSYNAASKHNGIKQVSLEVRKGEIVGIAGVDGNGQSQLAQIATGVLVPEEGTIAVHAKRIFKFDPGHFIDKNISHISEDRNRMGLVGKMTVKENLILKTSDSEQLSRAKGWLMKKKAIAEFANDMKDKYDIRCASVDQEVRNLSGGNQQKVVLARELEMDPELLVAVHPTRGLDIGATEYVHHAMIDSRDNGCGVLLISADFDEILTLSDRIAVMYEGEIVGIYDGVNPPIHEISLAMSGKLDEEDRDEK